MDELEAHLRAEPDDLAAWLVYGDWLLEQGDRRGALVRSRRELTKEERARYRGPLPEEIPVSWRNGFVVEIEVPAMDMRAVPLLETFLAEDASRLLSSVVVRRFTWRDAEGLELPPVEREGDALVQLLALDLRRLGAFSIRYHELTDEQLEALVRARLAIHTLDLRYTKLTDAGLARLAEAPWFAGVRRLNLCRNPLSAASAPLLAGRDVDVRFTDVPNERVFEGTREPMRGPPPKLASGLSISPRMTERHTAVRYIDKRSLSRTITKDCATVEGLPGFVAVYVDPHEWSFRTYENVIPLDRLPVGELALGDHAEIGSEIHRFTLRGELPAFDDLPLYTKPLNAASRGGERYIFHSAPLAAAIDKALRVALPALAFAHVNPVFRCNRFEPGDEPFQRHFDTPYYDPARNHISQYTVLIYLTGGSAAPAIQIESLAVHAIEAMQCFVFHQAYEHAGAAFTAGRKVFLRTELIFEEPNVTKDTRIAALFSKACYLTGESVRDPALARDADRAYNAVAAAHWGAVLPELAEAWVHKEFRGVHWLANGYDFWFPRALPLADCAALTLLDYFNCQVGGTPFRSLVTTEVMRDVDQEAFLAGKAAPQLRALDKAGLFPEAERVQCCCPGHARSNYEPTTSEDVVDIYTRAQTFARARIGPAPIVMLGQEIYLDATRFLVDGNKLHVLSKDQLTPINFAACWNCRSSPPNYVDIDVTANVVQPLVPPILWEATPGTHHLMFDFFRNDWLVSHAQYDVPVPVIRIEADETIDDGDPWLAAARRADPDDSLPPVRRLFWSYDNAVIRELYADRKDP